MEFHISIVISLFQPDEMAADEAEVFAPRRRRTKTDYMDRYTVRRVKHL